MLEVLDLVEVRVNCEQNSLLYLVRPRRGCALPDFLRAHVVAAKENGRVPQEGARWSVTAIVLLSQNRLFRTFMFHVSMRDCSSCEEAKVPPACMDQIV